MLTTTVLSYDESSDIYKCVATDSIMPDVNVEISIPALMMPYIAPTQVADCEDLPYDLVGSSFHLRSILLDEAR